MAPKQTGPHLPNDPQTLRFYLEGIHHFIQWCEVEIADFALLPLVGPGRLFLAIQQILEPYVGTGSGVQRKAIPLETAYPSASFDHPFEVTPAFLAVRPFLDGTKIAAKLASCRAAVEAIEPVPDSLHIRQLPVRKLPVRISKVKRSSNLPVEDNKAGEQQAEQRRQHQEKLTAAFAAFQDVLGPFRESAETIVLKIGGVGGDVAGGEDGTGFVSASLLVGVDERVGTYKKLKAIVDGHPDEIRRRKPSPQRLEIDAADLHRFLHKRDSAAFKKGTSDDSVEGEDGLTAEQDKRRQQVRRGRGLPNIHSE